MHSIPDEVMVRESGIQDYQTGTSLQFSDDSNKSFLVKTESTVEFSIGTKVLHPKFGSGIVINRSGEEEELKLEIFFKGPHGKKKLIAKLANLITL